MRRDNWQARLAPLPAARDRTAGKSSGCVDGSFLRGIGVADSGSGSGPFHVVADAGFDRIVTGDMTAKMNLEQLRHGVPELWKEQEEMLMGEEADLTQE